MGWLKKYQYAGRTKQPSNLWETDKTAWMDSVISANANKDWVQQLYNPMAKTLDIDGVPRQQFLEYGEGDGREWIYPTINRVNGVPTYFGNNAGYYAAQKQLAIPVQTPEQAQYFLENSSNLSNVLPIDIAKQRFPDSYKKNGGMIKRADGSYSQRGLWDNIRANAGSGKKPTKEMLKQEKKIRAAEKKQYGGWLNQYQDGGVTQAHPEYSIVDYLASQGQDYSKGHRAELAQQYGIQGYDYSAEKNLELLSKLKAANSLPQKPAGASPVFTELMNWPETKPVPPFQASKKQEKFNRDDARNAANKQAAFSNVRYQGEYQGEPTGRISTSVPVHIPFAGTQYQGEYQGQVMRTPVTKPDSFNIPNIIPVNVPYRKPADSNKQPIIKNTNFDNIKFDTNQGLDSGIVVDKQSNQAFIIKNHKVVHSFPVLTGSNPQDNPNLFSVDELETNKIGRTTPAGVYDISPNSNIYGKRGFDLYNPDLIKNVKIHTIYPEDYAARMKGLLSSDPERRRMSYGCINAQDCDIDQQYKYFPQGGKNLLHVLPVNQSKSINDYMILPNQKYGGYSTTGYKADSPDRNNPYNIIPSGRITMQNVPHPVMGIDNFGNKQMMQPGGEYQFQGDRVFEVPAMKEGGIPQRYKNMGFSRVGQKKSGDGQHKWKVLAKKGDSYKVVQGGYRGMQDFKQHHSEERKDRFWDRMGGRDSSKAKDPFSPLYWHKRFGTWEYGGAVEMQDGGQNPPKFVTNANDPSLQSYRDSLQLAINSRRAEAEYLNKFKKANIAKSTAAFELPSLMTMVKSAKDSYNPLVDLIKNGLPKGDNSRQVVDAFSADTITQAADIRRTTVNGKIPRQINSGRYIPNSVANKKIPLLDNSTTGDDTKDYPQTDLKNIATRKGNITQENITPSRRYIHNNRLLSDVEDPFIGYSTPSGNRYKLTDVYQPSYSIYNHPTIKPEKTDQFYYNSAETTDDPSSFNYQANEMYNVNFPIYEYPHNPVYLKDSPIPKSVKPTNPAKTQIQQLQTKQSLLPINRSEQLLTQQVPLPSFTPKLPSDYSITMRNVNPNLKDYSEEQIEFKTPKEQQDYITNNRLHRLSTGMYEDVTKYKDGGMIKRADGSYSQRGLWDNIRANAGSGKQPTKEMLQQEKKIRGAEKKEYGGWLDQYQGGGNIKKKPDTRSPEQKYQDIIEQLNSISSNPAELRRIQELKNQGVMAETAPRRSVLNKAGAIARNPMTAAQYVVQGQPIPDYFEKGDRNIYENAMDVLNPMTYVDAAKRTATLEHLRNMKSLQDLPSAAFNTAMDAGALIGLGSELRARPTILPVESPTAYQAGELVKNVDNLKDLQAAKKFAKKYGYELPSDLERVAQSDELTNRTIRGLMNRHNTFARGVSTNWKEIAKKNPQILKNLEQKGFDLSTEEGSKAAAEYMSTTIPSRTGYGRYGLKPGEDALYLSNSIPTAEGYTYGEGYVNKVKRPTNFSSSNRQDWITANDFDAHLNFKNSPYGTGIVKNDYIKRFPTNARELLAATGDPNKMEKILNIIKEKEVLYNDLAGESWKKYNNLISGLKYNTDAKYRLNILSDKPFVRDVPNLLDKTKLKYLEGKKELAQLRYNSLPYIDFSKQLLGDKDIYKALGKNLIGKVDPFSHYAIKGNPEDKVLELIQSKKITPEIWENTSRGHINKYSDKLSRKEYGGWLDEYQSGGVATINSNTPTGVSVGTQAYQDWEHRPMPAPYISDRDRQIQALRMQQDNTPAIGAQPTWQQQIYNRQAQNNPMLMNTIGYPLVAAAKLTDPNYSYTNGNSGYGAFPGYGEAIMDVEAVVSPLKALTKKVGSKITIPRGYTGPMMTDLVPIEPVYPTSPYRPPGGRTFPVLPARTPTGMPTLVDVPELTKEQQILKSFGLNPREIKKKTEYMSLEAPKGNMYGQNQVLIQQSRLLNPKTKAKFFEHQAPVSGPKESILQKMPADYSNRITPENYEDFINRVHSSTDYDFASAPKTGANLGIGSYGRPGMVYKNAPLNNLGKDIINAHEKNHGIFAGTLSKEMNEDLLKPFGTSKPIPHYSGKHQPDEVLARMAQFKNAVGIGDNQTFTLGHLNLIRKNYPKQFLDNGITEMLEKIKPGTKTEKEFLKNMNKYAFGTTGIGAGVAASQEDNQKYGGWLSKYK